MHKVQRTWSAFLFRQNMYDICKQYVTSGGQTDLLLKRQEIYFTPMVQELLAFYWTSLLGEAYVTSILMRLGLLIHSFIHLSITTYHSITHGNLLYYHHIIELDPQQYHQPIWHRFRMTWPPELSWEVTTSAKQTPKRQQNLCWEHRAASVWYLSYLFFWGLSSYLA